MPSIGAMEIVNKLFSGSKDVSSEVNDAMNTMTVAALEKQKTEIAKNFLNEPEEKSEEKPNDTDNGEG